MKIIYLLNKAVRQILGFWMVLILIVVLISQAKRLTALYGGEVNLDDLQVEVEHIDEQTCAYYEEAPEEKEWEGVVVCIGDIKTHWTEEQLEVLPDGNKVSTAMEVLTVTLPSKSLIFRESSVTYVKYGCLGETSFSDEEIEYYKKAAADKFTYERHVKLRLKDAVAYRQFVPNENMD